MLSYQDEFNTIEAIPYGGVKVTQIKPKQTGKWKQRTKRTEQRTNNTIPFVNKLNKVARAKNAEAGKLGDKGPTWPSTQQKWRQAKKLQRGKKGSTKDTTHAPSTFKSGLHLHKQLLQTNPEHRDHSNLTIGHKSSINSGLKWPTRLTPRKISAKWRPNKVSLYDLAEISEERDGSNYRLLSTFWS